MTLPEPTTGSSMSIPGELAARASCLYRAVRRPADLPGMRPGRVELLGNHTDYNGGLVMAVAIDRFTIAVGRPARVRSAGSTRSTSRATMVSASNVLSGARA